MADEGLSLRVRKVTLEFESFSGKIFGRMRMPTTVEAPFVAGAGAKVVDAFKRLDAEFWELDDEGGKVPVRVEDLGMDEAGGLAGELLELFFPGRLRTAMDGIGRGALSDRSRSGRLSSN